jgi:hypothetical protein
VHPIFKCLNASAILVRYQRLQTVHGKAIDANMQLSGHKLGQSAIVENPKTSYQQWFVRL